MCVCVCVCTCVRVRERQGEFVFWLVCLDFVFLLGLLFVREALPLGLFSYIIYSAHSLE